MKKMQLTKKNKCFFHFLKGPLCPISVTQPRFQFTANTTVSMAVKSNYLEDRMSAANLQMEGHADMPSKSTKDPGSQEHWVVVPPACHHGPQPGGHSLAALIPGTAWEYT